MVAPAAGFTLLLAWLPLLVGIPLGVPPGPEDPLLMQVAPEQCLFYTSWAPTQAADADSENETERLLAEPDIQRALKTLETEAQRLLGQLALREQDRAASLAAQLAPKLLRAMLTEGGAIYVADVEVVAGQPPSIRAAALVKLGAESQEVMNLIRSLQQLLPQPPATVSLGGSRMARIQLDPQAPSLTWGEWRGYLVVGVGGGAVEELVASAETPVPEWLSTLAEQISVPRRSTFAYLNVAGIRDRLLSVAGPQAQAMVAAAGLANLESLVSVTGLDDQGFVTRSQLALDGPPAGLLGILAGKPLTADELRAIPADATVAAAVRLNLGEGLERLQQALAQVEPRAAREFRRGLDEMNQALRLDVERDLLAALGDAWYVYTAPSSGGLMSGWTAAVSVQDARRLQRTHDMLVGMVRAQLGPDGPQIRTMEAGEHDVFYVSGGEISFPMAPAWTITDREFVLGLFPQAVVSHITRSADHPSLVESEALAGAFGEDAGLVAMSYVDTQAVFDVAYPFVQMGAQLAFSQLPPEAGRLDVTLLPPASAIRPHLAPTISLTGLTPDGFMSETRQTLPGASVGASAPIATALLLPAVQAARQAARRTQSMNNMKQIGLAMHNYHDTFRGFPAAYSTDADGKPLLSWRVFILPYIEQQQLFEQFHLDEPWDSEHNKQLIAKMPPIYRSPTSSAAEGMTVYVTPRGPVTVFPEPDESKEVGKFPTDTRFAEITDGTSNTIAALEVSDEQAVIWTKPDDYEYNPEVPLRGAVGQHPAGLLALFCDGSVRFLAESIDADIVNALFTRNGGEVIPQF